MYGSAPEGRAMAEERVRQACILVGQRVLARAAQASLRDLAAVVKGVRPVSSKILARLDRAASLTPLNHPAV